MLPSEVFDLRSEAGKKGFPGLDDFWITVVPIVKFDGDDVVEIELHPVRMNNKCVQHRGKPYLVYRDEAKYVIEHVAGLSDEFGTNIEMRGDVGVVRV